MREAPTRGSGSTHLARHAPRTRSPCRVTAEGGLGGHSGVQIALGHANAIKVLGRVLRETFAVAPFGLVSLDGGKSRNAIHEMPWPCARFQLRQEAAFRAAVESATATVRDAFSVTDPGATATLATADQAPDAWTEEATARACGCGRARADRPARDEPCIRQARRDEHIARRGGDRGDCLTLHSLTRSSNDAALPEVIGALEAAARLAGGDLEVKHNYNGWRPDLDSKVLAVARTVYERLFDEPPGVTGDPRRARNGGDRQARSRRSPRHARHRPADQGASLRRAG